MKCEVIAFYKRVPLPRQMIALGILAAVATAGHTESAASCSDRMKLYLEFDAMFVHYALWEKWKWRELHDVYDAENEYAFDDVLSFDNFLWDDFLLQAPYDPPNFARTMTTLHNLVEKGVPPGLAASLLCALEAVEDDGYRGFFDEYFEGFWDDRVDTFVY